MRLQVYYANSSQLKLIFLDIFFIQFYLFLFNRLRITLHHLTLLKKIFFPPIITIFIFLFNLVHLLLLFFLII
jgi:hypothetical protein